jgi:hypothetical protein
MQPMLQLSRKISFTDQYIDAARTDSTHPLQIMVEPLRSFSLWPPIVFGIFTRTDDFRPKNPVTGGPTGSPALDETASYVHHVKTQRNPRAQDDVSTQPSTSCT